MCVDINNQSGCGKLKSSKLKGSVHLHSHSSSETWQEGDSVKNECTRWKWCSLSIEQLRRAAKMCRCHPIQSPQVTRGWWHFLWWCGEPGALLEFTWETLQQFRWGQKFGNSVPSTMLWCRNRHSGVKLRGEVNLLRNLGDGAARVYSNSWPAPTKRRELSRNSQSSHYPTE